MLDRIMSENTLTEKSHRRMCKDQVICESCRNICDGQVLGENGTEECECECEHLLSSEQPNAGSGSEIKSSYASVILIR